MKRNSIASLALCALLAACGGCGDSAGGAAAAGAGSEPAKEKSIPLVGHRLIGAWEGVIEINESEVHNRLSEKGDDIDPAETIAILKSMTMAIDFHDDGTMTMSAAMNIPGGPSQSEGAGRFEIISDNGSQLFIRSMEEGRDPEEIPLRFVDTDTFTMAPMGPNKDIGVMRFRRVAHVAATISPPQR